MEQMDVFMAVGTDCRSVNYVRKHGLCFFAAPGDWFSFRNPQRLLALFQTGFSDFFQQIEERGSADESDYRTVYDIKNHVKSIHHFQKSLPLAVAQRYVRQRAGIRYRQMDRELQNVDSVGLVGNWSAEQKDLIEFLTGFAALYPGKRVVLYNMHHDPEAQGLRKTEAEVSPHIFLREYYFCDQDTKTNDKQWMGNVARWTEVMEQLTLTEKGKRRMAEVMTAMEMAAKKTVGQGNRR